jgi:hypothetical protein
MSSKDKVVVTVRVVFGLMFLASGIAGLLGVTPPPSSTGAEQLLAAMAATGYLLPLLSAVQAAAGFMLVSGRMIPLALFALAPVVVQVLAFRLFVTPLHLLPIGLVLLAGEAVLLWWYRAAWAPLLSPS